MSSVAPSRVNPLLPWTDQRLKSLERYWLEGFSASQTARLLGGTTRNAVIGIVYRRGIKRQGAGAPIHRDPTGWHNRYSAKPKPKPKLRVFGHVVLDQAPDIPLPPLREAVEAPLARHWMERKHSMCSWPVSGSGADTWSCCAPVRPGSSWCREHIRIGTVPGKGVFAKSEKEMLRALRRWVAA